MKNIFKLVIAAVLSIVPAAGALSAPAFDIDFYGGSTSLSQGVYDTNTNIGLENGASVSVDIIASGFDEGDGLLGWSLRLDYGDGLLASNLERNYPLWPMAIREASIQNGYLTIEGGTLLNTGAQGDNLLLFSFDLTCIDETASSMLTLWDFDMGGPRSDTISSLGISLDDHFPVGLATANVPIPAAAWLFGSGLLGLLAIRRKR